MLRLGLSGLAAFLILGCYAAQPRVTGDETDLLPSPILGPPSSQDDPWDLDDPGRSYPEQETYAYSPRGPGTTITGGPSVGVFGSALSTTVLDFGPVDVDYDELWDSGIGFHLEGMFNFLVMERPQRTFSVGPFLKIDSAVHPGDRFEIAPDLFWEADDLTVTKLFLGVRARSTFSRFIVGGELGFGPVFLSKVDVFEEDLFFGTTFEGELFEETTTFGLELSMFIGGRFPVGPRAYVSPFLYGGIAALGAPERGENLSPAVDIEGATQSTIGIGIAFEFGGAPSPSGR
ncbi:MAG: hypothetical protein O7H41_04120 [Planctomycetota bacterium]|nr:hypothetical protein [Planctomycetota bacterium]